MVGGKGTLGGAAQKYNEDAANSFNEKGLDPCVNCGRTFLPDRLVIHMRSCKKQVSKT